MTVRSQSFANQPDFWARATIGAGPALVIPQTGNKAVWSRTSAGIYVLTLDGGGADQTNCVCLFDINAGVPFTYQVVHTLDTVKTLTLRDIGGVVLEATALGAVVFKLS